MFKEQNKKIIILDEELGILIPNSESIFRYILEAMPKLSTVGIRKDEYFDGEEKSEEVLTFSILPLEQVIRLGVVGL